MRLFPLILLIIFIWFVAVPVVKFFLRARRQTKAWREFYRQAMGGTQQPGDARSRQARRPSATPKKVFSKDDGEYVDFEEITDTEATAQSSSGTTYTRTHTETRYTGPREDQIADADWEEIP